MKRIALVIYPAVAVSALLFAAADDSVAVAQRAVVASATRVGTAAAAYTDLSSPSVSSRRRISRRIILEKGVKKPTEGGELVRAKKILGELITKYPILQGTTVEMGDARGYQALCFYRTGRIVISPSHKASLDRILNHEIWHVVDYRDNGVINWGESLPPANASSFAY